MPTAFTHALVGSALCVAAPERVPRRRLVVALALLAVLPDADVLGFGVGIPYDHWLGHRGLLHSLPFAVVAGVVTAALAFPEPRRLSPAWWGVAALLALAAASHGTLDALTDAGLGVGFWVPFDDARVFLPWRPLPTSPIGVEAFFRSRGAAILATEMLWVWVPVLLVAGGVALLRHRGR